MNTIYTISGKKTSRVNWSAVARRAGISLFSMYRWRRGVTLRRDRDVYRALAAEITAARLDRLGSKKVIIQPK